MISVLPTASGADVEGVMRILATITDPEKHKAALEELIKVAEKAAEQEKVNRDLADKAAVSKEQANRALQEAKELSHRAEILHGRRNAEYNTRNSALDQLSRKLAKEKENLTYEMLKSSQELEVRERNLTKREVAVAAREQRNQDREAALNVAEQQYARKHGELQRALAAFGALATGTGG